jgi:uncharacterized membrane protein
MAGGVSATGEEIAMRRIEESLVINRPCDEVFAYLEDRANDPEWMVSVRESHWLDTGGTGVPGPTGIGRRGRMVMRIRGREVEFIDEVAEYEPGRRIGHRTIQGPFPLNTACLCEPASGGCRATVVGEADRFVRGPFGPLVEPFIARAVRRGFRSDLARLKRILESSALEVG